MSLKIYTKTGDKGQTSLFGGKRVPKYDLRVEAYGTVDELNSLLGVILSRIQKLKFKSQKYNSKVKSELTQIQNDLLTIGSALASPHSNKQQATSNRFEQRIEQFENLIDELTAKLPELKNFILPGGGEVGALLHFARTICRRGERRVVHLSKKEKIDENIVKYFNRLSDLLFTMARFVNYKEKKKETIWQQS